MNEKPPLSAESIASLAHDLMALKDRPKLAPVCQRSEPTAHFLENNPKARRKMEKRQKEKPARKPHNEVLRLQQNKIEELIKERDALRRKLDSGTFIHRSSTLRNLMVECLAILHNGSGHCIHPNLFRRQIIWNIYKIEFVTGREMIQCCHCFGLFGWDDFTVEHLKPKTMGGGDELHNLRASCKLCNWRREVEDLSEPDFVPEPESFLL